MSPRLCKELLLIPLHPQMKLFLKTGEQILLWKWRRNIAKFAALLQLWLPRPENETQVSVFPALKIVHKFSDEQATAASSHQRRHLPHQR